DAGRTGDRVGRGDERIGAVVDVEHSPLCSLEYDGPAGSQRVVAELRRVGDVGLQAMTEGDVLLGHGVQVERRVLRMRAERLPLRLQRGHDLLAEDLLVEEVLDPDAEPRRL